MVSKIKIDESPIQSVCASKLSIGQLGRIVTGSYKDYIIVKTYTDYVTVYAPDPTKTFHATWDRLTGDNLQVEILPSNVSIILHN